MLKIRHRGDRVATPHGEMSAGDLLRYLARHLLSQADVQWCQWQALPIEQYSDDELSALWGEPEHADACNPFDRRCLEIYEVGIARGARMQVTFRGCASAAPITVALDVAVAREP